MKFIDWFAGVGGVRLGLEMAGHTCVGWCEYDKFAQTSYRAEYNPDAKGEWFANDIRTVSAMELPKADLWCFGFPCQSISVAGKQDGFYKKNGEIQTDIEEGEQTRSGLFFEIVRLLRELPKEDRPQWLLAENVKNLLNIEGGWIFAKCLVALGEIGYVCEWQLFNTRYSYIVGDNESRTVILVPGVPQNRERIFLLGRRIGTGCERKVFPIARANEEDCTQLSQIGRLKTTGNGFEGESGAAWPNPNRMRVYDTDGIAPTLNCCKGGGLEPHIVAGVNEVGYSVSKDGKKIQSGHVYGTDGVAPTLTTGTGGNHEPHIVEQIPMNDVDGISRTIHAGYGRASVTNFMGNSREQYPCVTVVGNKNPCGHGNGGNIYDSQGLSPTICCGDKSNTFISVKAVLTPDRIEKRQNGRRMKEDGEPMFTLTAQDRHGIAIEIGHEISKDGNVMQSSKVFDDKGSAPTLCAGHGSTIPNIVVKDEADSCSD